MKRSKLPANLRSATSPRRSPARRGSPLPVAATVLSAVAIMAAWQIRLTAEEHPAALPAESAAPAESAPELPAAGQQDSADEPAAVNNRRLREGTQLANCLGHFRQSGDSIAFIDENGREIGGLPNLNLERITRMLKAVEEPEGIWWSVSGTVTEFSGRNYVLITRAVYKAATPPPLPETLSPEAEPGAQP